MAEGLVHLIYHSVVCAIGPQSVNDEVGVSFEVGCGGTGVRGVHLGVQVA